jgi:hypothetical protein
MNKYLLNKYLFIILFSLFIPQTAFGFVGAVVDLLKKKLQGAEKLTHPIGDIIIYVFAIYIIVFILLVISTLILQHVINQQAAWLTLDGNALVEAGFAFISSLSNMFLILILLAVAFGIILKIENFQAKKLLPRLIGVALLLNFSLVFIGMMIDISHIFYNTILGNNSSLVIDVIRALIGGILGIIGNITTWVVTLITAYMIPGVSTLKQVALVFGFVGIFGPTFMVWISQIVIGSLIAGVLFIFIILFTARVFIVQILAILSPLAFLCLILPQTKKYFDEWLKHLISWIFLGVYLLFFLVIGLRAAYFLQPSFVDFPYIPALPAWVGLIDGTIFFYFFLLIYLGIVLWITKKTMPAGVQPVLNGLKTIGGIMLGVTGGKILGGKLKNQIIKERGHGLEKWGQKLQKKGYIRNEPFIPKFWHYVQRKVGEKAEEIGREKAAKAELAQKTDWENDISRIKKETEEERFGTIHTAGNNEKKLNALQASIELDQADKAKEYLIQRSKSEGKTNPEEAAAEEITKLHKYAQEEGLEREKIIEAAYPQYYEKFGITNKNITDSKTREEAKKEIIEEIEKNFQERGKPIPSNIEIQINEKQITEKIQNNNLKELIKRALKKPNSIDPNVFADKTLKPILLETLRPGQINELIENNKMRDTVLNLFQDEINRLEEEQTPEQALESLIKINAPAVRFLTSYNAQKLGVTFTRVSDEKIKEIFKNTIKHKQKQNTTEYYI